MTFFRRQPTGKYAGGGAMSTGDPLYDLIAGVCKQAVQDAKKGNQDAIEFLNVCLPDWRELAARAERRSRSKPMATEQEFHIHRGEPAQRSNGKYCAPDDDNANRFHQIDDEAGVWTLDGYNTRYR